MSYFSAESWAGASAIISGAILDELSITMACFRIFALSDENMMFFAGVSEIGIVEIHEESFDRFAVMQDGDSSSFIDGFDDADMGPTVVVEAIAIFVVSVMPKDEISYGGPVIFVEGAIGLDEFSDEEDAITGGIIGGSHDIQASIGINTTYPIGTIGAKANS